MQGRRILVVDDEPAIPEVLRAYLSAGFAVETAATGSEALLAFARRKPDLVVLNLMFPDIAGEEVCRQLRRESHVPILMLTARTGQDDIVQGLLLGADDDVTKPFSPELSARARAILRQAQGTLHHTMNGGTSPGGLIQLIQYEGFEPVGLDRTETPPAQGRSGAGTQQNSGGGMQHAPTTDMQGMNMGG